MGSLFTKIFLAFWLTAVLLGGAFYLASRSLGDRELTEAESRLAAHADTAANLYREQGMPAVSRWLRSLRREGSPPLLVLDEKGRVPFMQRVPPRLKQRLGELPLEKGARRLFPGHYLLIAPISDEHPRYFLATIVDLGHLHRVPPWSRIVIALLISGLVSLALASLLTRPIRHLRRAAQTMAGGDLNVRVGGKGKDEVAELARDFDVMAERLHEMLQSQRRLLSDVSHELRSPLARLRVALELMAKSGDQEKAMRRIEKEADELERLVSNLLSLARLESGQMTLERKRLALTPLLQAIVNDADFEAEAKQRQVTLEVEQDFTIEGDPVLLRAAVENVVRNAVRHTREQSTVSVRLAADGNNARIEVCDRGEGVPEAELSRMFEAFTRIGEARDRHSGGFGLGLSITGQVIGAHGGRAIAHNRADGGLCVTLSLPSVAETLNSSR
jgi:two-component system sensor histidine kinase CpxA